MNPTDKAAGEQASERVLRIAAVGDFHCGGAHEYPGLAAMFEMT